MFLAVLYFLLGFCMILSSSLLSNSIKSTVDSFDNDTDFRQN